MPIKPITVLQTPCPSQMSCVCANQAVVTRPLTVPETKPDIEQVMYFNVSSEVTEWKVINTPLGPKVIAGGMVHISAQYVGAVPSQSVHVAHWDVPWHNFFLCAGGTGATGICNVTACVEVAELSVTDPRHIDEMVIMAICATACPETTCPTCP